MRMLGRILFLPLYLVTLIISIMAEVIKQAFSFVWGIFLLVMMVCMAVTLLNHAWSQCLLLAVLILLGYGCLFGVVAAKVLIEEVRNYCFDKVF